MMRRVNIGKICLTQWMNIFQMVKALRYKNQAWVKEPFKVQGRPMDFNAAKNEKSSDMVSASILQLIF